MHHTQTDSQLHYRISGTDDRFRATLTVETPETGIELVHLKITADRPEMPPPIKLSWTHPVIDVQGVWHPNGYRNRGLAPDWFSGYRSNAASSAPVVCLFGGDSRSRLTFAFSDTLNPVVCKAGVHEETAEFYCSVSLFEEPGAPLDRYEATLRVDRRELAYFDSLDGVRRWWSGLPGLAPAPVPAAAREPMYSTWYSLHQYLSPEEIEAQCRLAAELGCGAVIADDGWQTANNERGYAYCGDWEACADKMPDMAAHVERVHALGMKYMLWYSVPYVGRHSRAWERFRGRMLYTLEERGWGVVDPRFPEVREYLIGIYTSAQRVWKLDGFKLDFIDSFNPPAGTGLEFGGGRDYDAVPEAVDRLMSDIIARLSAADPGILIEFRQAYVGPGMRKYGNMLRAADCPNDAVENRVRTLDIRLLCGETAAHADMLMWHPDEPAASAALQLINVLFSVPQISLRLDRLPPAHQEMVAYWLAFWRSHRDALLDGRLEPYHPELLYPYVLAGDATKLIAAVYQPRTIVPLRRELPDMVVLVNGTREDGIYMELAEDKGEWEAHIRDCRGRTVACSTVRLQTGVHPLPVPPAGTVELRRQ